MVLAQPIWQQTLKMSTRCLITWEAKPNDYSIWQKNKHSLLSLRSHVSSVKQVLIINLFNIHSASAGDNLEPFTQINSHRGHNALKCSGWIPQTRFHFLICFSLARWITTLKDTNMKFFPVCIVWTKWSECKLNTFLSLQHRNDVRLSPWIYTWASGDLSG